MIESMKFTPNRQPMRKGIRLPLRHDECVHLGLKKSHVDVNGNAVNCRGKHLFACDLHGECRINDPRAAHNCQTCGDYSVDLPDDPAYRPGLRHILYHVYPMRGTGTWQRNIDQLVPRLPLFSGKRICAIAVDNKTDDADAVKQHLGDSFEYLLFPNDPFKREVISWVPLWERVIEEPGVTFYAHAKGVRHPTNPGVSVHFWTEMMYETLLDYWPTVEHSLRSHPLTGTFKKVGRWFARCPSRWHYSGSFFWARNDKLREKPWRNPPQEWWGTEAAPGTWFPQERAGVIFHENPKLNIYNPQYCQGVLKELRKWRLDHSPSPSITGTSGTRSTSASCGTPSQASPAC